MTIDAHVHLWRLSRRDNVALTPTMRPIYMDREPADLKPIIDAAGVGRVVVVQAAETLAETLFIIGLAREFPWIAGIVAWVELASPAVEEEVSRNRLELSRQRRAPGAGRQQEHRLDARQPAGTEAFGRCRIAPFRSTFSVQNWREIPLATVLAKRWPGLAIVLDHCGKPDIANNLFDPWARHIDELASLPNVVCKFSGLLNCARPGASAADVQVYAKHVLKAFGSNRVMWASDWPPLDLASDYATWKRISNSVLQRLPGAQLHSVMVETAMRVYRLD